MQALEDLDYLAALDDDGNLSEVGIIMSELPLEPPLAKALIAACEYDCVDELLTIAAMLTGQCGKVHTDSCFLCLSIIIVKGQFKLLLTLGKCGGFAGQKSTPMFTRGLKTVKCNPVEKHLYV